MNIKILNQLELIFQVSPQLLRDSFKLQQTIQGTFNVWVDDVDFNNLGDLAERIDDKVLEKYFSEVWQSETKKYKYSGLSLVDEINNSKPEAVLDAGCGFNEFKGKIHNLIGIDPYNNKADIKVKIADYTPDRLFNAIICLGSINFGSTDKIFTELERIVNLAATKSKMYFRVNPGIAQPQSESKWIVFYPWTPNFIINSADYFGVDVIELRKDYKDRMYFVWSKNK